jgi:hypothetical protein
MSKGNEQVSHRVIYETMRQMRQGENVIPERSALPDLQQTPNQHTTTRKNRRRNALETGRGIPCRRRTALSKIHSKMKTAKQASNLPKAARYTVYPYLPTLIFFILTNMLKLNKIAIGAQMGQFVVNKQVAESALLESRW